MWTFLFAGCCLLLYAQAIPAPGHGALAGFCNTDYDCGEGECCVRFRKSFSDVRRFVRGKCKKRGTSGSKCLVRDFGSLVTDIHLNSCPCQIRHTCEGTRRYRAQKRESGICVKRCSSSIDCRRNECCVSDNRLRGKRSADRPRRRRSGHCRPMGRKGSDCLVNNGSGRPDDVVFHSCPCRSNAKCIGRYVFDAPLGELGICGQSAPYTDPGFDLFDIVEPITLS